VKTSSLNSEEFACGILRLSRDDNWDRADLSNRFEAGLQDDVERCRFLQELGIDFDDISCAPQTSPEVAVIVMNRHDSSSTVMNRNANLQQKRGDRSVQNVFRRRQRLLWVQFRVVRIDFKGGGNGKWWKCSVSNAKRNAPSMTTR
jgi:hypothetical protein